MNNSFVEIQQKLKTFFLKEKQKRLVYTLCYATLSFSLLLLCVSVIETIFWMTAIVRFVLFLFFILGTLGVIFFYGRKWMRFRFSEEWVAKQIWHKLSIKDRLLNVIQIFRSYGETNSFVQKEINILHKEISEVNIMQLINYKRMKKTMQVTIVAFLASVLLIAATPLKDGLYRVLFFTKQFSIPAEFKIVSLSKDIKISRGENVMVRFNIETTHNDAKLPTKIYLRMIDADGFLLPEISLFADSSKVFQYKFQNPPKKFSYYAVASERASLIQSEIYVVTVLDKPNIQKFQLVVKPPVYTKKLSQKIEENFGDIKCVQGSIVQVSLQSTQSLFKADIFFSDSTILKMDVDDKIATGSFQVKRNITYKFAITNQNGLQNKSDAVYSVLSIPDEIPLINILVPRQREKELTDMLEEPLSIEIKDDYGFSFLKIKYRISKSLYIAIDTTFHEFFVPMVGGERLENEWIVRTVGYQWKLAQLGIIEGDEVEFFAEVSDNDNYSSYQKARTDLHHFRVPTLEEFYKEMNKEEKNITASIDDKINQVQNLQNEMNRIQNDLKQKSKVEWQDKKSIEKTMQKQKELQEDIKKVVESMKDMIEKSEEKNLMSPETLEKYKEVQKLLEEAKFPQLQDEMKKIQKAMETMNDQEVREEMKELGFNEEKFNKMLERVKELIQRTQLERKFDELTKKLNTMAKRQDEIERKTENASKEISDNQKNNEQLSREEQILSEQNKQFDESVKEAEQKMKEFSKLDPMPKDEFEKYKQERENDDVQKDIEEAMKDIQKGDHFSAQKKQKKIKEKLSKQSQQLSEIKSSMKKMQKEEVIEAMRNSIQSALGLSEQQEDVKEYFSNQQQSNTNGKQMKDMSQKAAVNQKNLLEDLKQLQANIEKASKRTTQTPQEILDNLSQAEKKMRQSLDDLDKFGFENAKKEMAGSMQSLNEFAMKSNDVLESLLNDNQDGQGQGEGEGMEGLSNSQRGLNQNTESMMGDGLKGNQEKRLRQLAAQQRAIQQQLQRYKQKERSQGNENMSRAIEKIAEDMETAARNLENNMSSTDVVNRQRGILSKMLEVSRALRKQDEDKKRESTTASREIKVSPPKERAIQTQSELQETLNKLKQYGYSESHEKLIRSYYKKMELKLKEVP